MKEEDAERVIERRERKILCDIDTGEEEGKKRMVGSKYLRETMRTMSGLAPLVLDLSERSNELHGIDLSKIDLTKLDLFTLDWSNFDLNLLDLSKWDLDFIKIQLVKLPPSTKTSFVNSPSFAPTIISVNVLMIVLNVSFVVLHIYFNLHAVPTFGLEDFSFLLPPLF